VFDDLEEARSAMGLDGPQVIIAEPIGPVRMCIREILIGAGFLITGEAETLPEALRLTLRMKPDLIIISLKLRGGSGLRLLKLLRTKFPDIKAILLTGDTTEVLDAAKHGEALLLAKPINRARLLELAHSLVPAKVPSEQE
jgi:DNA-binding NarL/FixJ family response regulator